MIFQSTPPHGERPLSSADNRLHHSHFNPRPRMGSDQTKIIFQRANIISIHAPAWGATISTLHRIVCKRISIHAPAWGATYCSPIASHKFSISIHAPAWGATCLHQFLRMYSIYFNPRPRMGSDQILIPEPLIPNHFNPRPRMGSDFDKTRPCANASGFQSTPPHGERRHIKIFFTRPKRHVAISIHAPAWGATAKT